jgi:predicted nucleic acid-binding Zn ribbon protein
MPHQKRPSKTGRRQQASYLAMGLAQFLNLPDDPQKVMAFRRLWPQFFPDMLWEIRLNPMPSQPSTLWGFYQNELRTAWHERFPVDRTLQLIRMSGGPPSPDDWRRPQVYGCQRALLILVLEPWRAKFCSLCSAPFAAEKPAAKFCSTKCFEKSRRETKRQWWKVNRGTQQSKRRAS